MSRVCSRSSLASSSILIHFLVNTYTQADGTVAVTTTAQVAGTVEVLLGPHTCTGAVVSVDVTTVTCTAAGVPAGRYPVTLWLDTQGYAETPAPVEVTVVPQPTAFQPTSGAVGGGTLLMITGRGFTNDTSLLTVTVAGQPCTVRLATPTSIECTTSATTGGGETQGALVVTVDGVGSGTSSA